MLCEHGVRSRSASPPPALQWEYSCEASTGLLLSEAVPDIPHPHHGSFPGRARSPRVTAATTVVPTARGYVLGADS